MKTALELLELLGLDASNRDGDFDNEELDTVAKHARPSNMLGRMEDLATVVPARYDEGFRDGARAERLRIRKEQSAALTDILATIKHGNQFAAYITQVDRATLTARRKKPRK